MHDCAGSAADTSTTRVHLLTGRSPPGGCGVEDYAAALREALRHEGLDVGLVPISSMGDLAALLRTARRAHTVVHLQYPMLSWRTSLLPLLAATTVRIGTPASVLVTFHEYSRAHWLRRALAILLGWSAHGWIATCPLEEERLALRLGRRKGRGVVPIAANIRVSVAPVERSAEPTLIFFGLLAPGKGLEDFLEAASRLTNWRGRIEVLGRPVLGHELWLEGLRARHGGVRFAVGLPEDEVSLHLRAANVAYLPYPDGVSERRGSALAALAHELQVVTSAGRSTTPGLARVVHLVQDVEEACRTISGLANGVVAPRPPEVIRGYLASRDWTGVARRLTSVYLALAAETSSGGRAFPELM
jgi:glycosyltransferase involved in cell wall biosynthesis